MPLIDTLFTVFKDAKELLCADQLNSAALLRHNKKLKKLIQLNNEKMINAQKLLERQSKKSNPEEGLSQEEIAEKNSIGKYSAIQRNLNALFPVFSYMASHPEQTQSLYAWLLDWQSSLWSKTLTPQREHLLSMEIDNVMKHFVEFNKDAAMAYYHAYREKLERASILVKHRMQGLFSEEEKLNEKLTEKFEEIRGDYFKEELKPTKTNPLDDWKKYFNNALQGQATQPTTILVLAMHYYDEPHAFAAILLWMLVHGVKPQVILHSGLLHQFLSGHIADIAQSGNEVNAVDLVYQHLNASNNPGAFELMGLAEKTSAYISGKKHQQVLPGFNRYNLIGQVQEKGKALTILSIDQIIRPDPNIIPDFENIRVLSASFGGTFLRLLASVPAVASAFTEEEWQMYLNGAMEEVGDEVTSFPDWFNLYSLIKKYQPSFKEQVFLKIINLAFMHRHQIDGDDRLLAKIRLLFDNVTKRMLIVKASTLVALLIILIVLNTRRLTQERYHTIEDEWAEKVQYLNYVRTLYPFENFPVYPATIYELQTEILRCCEPESMITHFDMLMRWMSPPQLSEEDALFHERQRLLVWVAREQDERAQCFIINRLLEKFKIKEVQWWLAFQHKTLFRLSCEAGNLLLVEQFFKGDRGFAATKEFELGLIGASRGGWLGVVKLLMGLEGEFALNDEAKFAAFIEAVRYAREEVILYFLEYKNNLFLSMHRSLLYQGLRSAIECHHKNIIDLLLRYLRSNQANIMSCGYEEFILVEVESMARALRIAVEAGAYDAVVLLCGSRADLLPNEEAIFQASRYAIAGRHTAILTYLCELEGEKAPSAEHIVNLLNHAILSDALAALDVILKLKTRNAPDKNAIFQALNHAIKLNNLRAFELILRVCGKKLFEVKIMGDIINNAVDDLLFPLFRKGKWDFILCFSRLNEVRAPSSGVIEKIIQGSAEQSRLDVALCLFKRWHKNMLPEDKDALFARLCDDAKAANHPGVVAALHDCFLSMLIAVPSEKISQAIVAYFVFLLKDKPTAEKYHVLAEFYKANMGVMGVEKAIAIFNLIDKNADAFGISTQPVKQAWEPGFIKRNGVDAWPAAWGVMRHLIFKAWRAELRSDQTTPRRQHVLITLFDGCGEPGGPHYKLMSMRRTSGKPHSKTSERIEEEIAKVRERPVLRPT